MAVIFKPIQERLTARFEQMHLQQQLRVESLADAGAREVDIWRRRVLQQLMTNNPPDVGFIESTLDAMEKRIKEVYRGGLINTALWSYSASTSIMIRTIPRRWFRVVNPVTVLAGEAAGIDLLDFDTPTEPVVGKRMGDKEWEDFIKANVFEPPSADEVEQYINNPINGESWPSRIDKLSLLVKDKDLLAKDLVQGYSAGQSLQQLAKMIEKHTAGVKSSAVRIARTEGQRVANQIQHKSFDQLGDLVAGLQIVATLDQNTRPEHATRNGTIHWNDLRKTPNIQTLPQLPDEIQCRCFDIPVLKPPRELANDPRLQAEFANAAGQPIPDPVSYIEWWGSADVGKRKQVVGVRRYETVKRKLGREPLWQDFVSPTGELLPVEALKSETAAQQAKRAAGVEAAIKQRSQMLQQVATYGFVSGLPVPKRPDPITPPITPPPVRPPVKPPELVQPLPPAPEEPQPEPTPEADPTPVAATPSSPPEPTFTPIPMPPKLDASKIGAAAKRKLLKSPRAIRDAADIDAYLDRINDDSKVKPYLDWSARNKNDAEKARKEFLASRPEANAAAASSIKASRAAYDSAEKERAKIYAQGNKIAKVAVALPKGPQRDEVFRQIAALNARIGELESQMNKSAMELRALIGGLSLKNVTANPLELADHYRFDIDSDGKTNLKKEDVHAPLRSIEKMIHPANASAAGDIKYGDSEDGRAYYSDRDRRVMFGKKDEPAVVVHEIGHLIDHNSGPEVKQMVEGFLAKRIRESGNQEIDVMRVGKATRSEYKPTEFGIPDDFEKGLSALPPTVKPMYNRGSYTGKFYGDGATEVLAMGMEAFYRDPYGFAERDPEFFDLVVGVMQRRGLP